MDLLEEMKDVFELATGATAFVNELLKIKNTKNKKNQNDSGYYSKLAASGDSSKLAASGDSSQLAASGDSSQLAASGYYSKLAASGDSSKLAASGDSSKLAASGYYSQLAASGYYSQLAASGDYSKLAASGDSSQLAASGDSSQLVASGYYSKLEITGKNSVGAAIGFKSIAKGIKDTWLTLAEYKQDKNNNLVVDYVKSEQIDGKKLKENTFYTLYNHEFTEVQIIDGVKTIILNRKKNVIKGLFLEDLKPCYVVGKDGVYSHGKTLKEAKDSLIYKISNRDTSMYKDYTLDTVISFEDAIKMYRVITGACEAGTRNFIENTLKVKKKKYTVSECIELTEGQYGSDKFKEFFNSLM